jgi:chromosome segregation ATPase
VQWKLRFQGKTAQEIELINEGVSNVTTLRNEVNEIERKITQTEHNFEFRKKYEEILKSESNNVKELNKLIEENENLSKNLKTKRSDFHETELNKSELRENIKKQEQELSQYNEQLQQLEDNIPEAERNLLRDFYKEKKFLSEELDSSRETMKRLDDK